MEVRIYRFAEFSLDPQARELRANGRLLRLPVSALDCLTYLINQRQRAVGRDELIAAVWGRTDISEKLLGQTMVRIRRALGDSAEEPRYVRTVARFGYRWIAETEEVDAAANRLLIVPDDAAKLPIAATATAVVDAVPPARTSEARRATPLQRMTRLRFGYIAGALSLIVAILLLAVVIRHRADGVPLPAVALSPETLNIVLPTQVRAADEWSWLRLGLMDLVAARLRRGGVITLNSESVVGLLKRSPGAEESPEMLPPHALEIRPSAVLDGDRWIVRLDAHGKNGDIISEARLTDVLASARAATDGLLVKLGHTPPDDNDTPPRALAELLQRAGAAALAERFEHAANLIDQAPAELQRAPDIDVLRALIEIRSGSYTEAERRLHLLLNHGTATSSPSTRARALNALGAVHVREDRPDEAAAEYDAAIALLVGRNDADPGVLGYAYMGRGMVASMRDQLDVAIADLGRARTEMEASGDELGSAIVGLDLGQVQMRQRRPADALATLRASESRLDRYGAREELVYTRVFESEAQLNLLDSAGALATTARFWPAETATGNERLRWRLLLARASALTANGLLKEADELIERIRSGSDPAQDADLRLETTALAAKVASARGRAEDAARLASAAATEELERDEPDLYLAMRLMTLRSLIAGDHLDEAIAESTRLQTWLASHDDAWHRAYASFAAAILAQAQGHQDAALQEYAEAAERIRGSAQPQDIITITQPYALALIDAGRLDEATAVVARLGAFADTNLDVAWAQARLYTALGRDTAQQHARERAIVLAGERLLPTDRAADTTQP